MNAWSFLGSFIAVLFIAPPLKAQTPEKCDSVLLANLADDSTIVDKSSAKDTAHYAACSMSYSDFGKTMGTSASGQYGAIGGSGSYNESNYNSWTQTNCSDSSSDASRDAYRYSSQRTFKSDIVSSWSQCMSNLQGLNCWAIPSGEDVEATVRWKSDQNGNPIIQNSSLFGGRAPSVGKGLLLDSNTTLTRGDRKILIRRDTSSSSVRAVLNANVNGAAVSCSFSAPGIVAVLPSAPTIQPSVEITDHQPYKYRWTFTALRVSDSSSPYSSEKLYLMLQNPCGGPLDGRNYQFFVSRIQPEVAVPLVPGCSTYAFGKVRLVEVKGLDMAFIYFDGGLHTTDGSEITVSSQPVASLNGRLK